ncbi:MAG: hypothetical protein P4M12_10645 [Gammaproteobacteria bacterium]|nr:hypothetical protein [Gammaproteobacteria bacterium]
MADVIRETVKASNYLITRDKAEVKKVFLQHMRKNLVTLLVTMRLPDDFDFSNPGLEDRLAKHFTFTSLDKLNEHINGQLTPLQKLTYHRSIPRLLGAPAGSGLVMHEGQSIFLTPEALASRYRDFRGTPQLPRRTLQLFDETGQEIMPLSPIHQRFPRFEGMGGFRRSSASFADENFEAFHFAEGSILFALDSRLSKIVRACMIISESLMNSLETQLGKIEISNLDESLKIILVTSSIMVTYITALAPLQSIALLVEMTRLMIATTAEAYAQNRFLSFLSMILVGVGHVFKELLKAEWEKFSRDFLRDIRNIRAEFSIGWEALKDQYQSGMFASMLSLEIRRTIRQYSIMWETLKREPHMLALVFACIQVGLLEKIYTYSGIDIPQEKLFNVLMLGAAFALNYYTLMTSTTNRPASVEERDRRNESWVQNSALRVDQRLGLFTHKNPHPARNVATPIDDQQKLDSGSDRNDMSPREGVKGDILMRRLANVR